MEDFFYFGEYYRDLSELLEDISLDVDDINDLSDDYTIEVNLGKLEPIVQFNSEWITERIKENRFSEQNSDNEVTQIMKILDDNIDFEKINSLIPRLYHRTNVKHYFTKNDLLEAVE